MLNRLLQVLPMALAMMCLGWPTYCPGQEPGLVLHYDFNQDFSSGQVFDSSGSNNHGLRFNVTNWISATNGVFASGGAGFQYVGFISNDAPSIYPISQYIAVTNLNGFAFLTNGTISVWAQFNSNVDRGMYLLDSGYSYQYARDKAASTNAWTLGRLYTPYLSFAVYPSTGGPIPIVNWPNDTIKSSGTTPNLGTLAVHLYTVTFDCIADRAIAYYDGQPYMTNSIGLPWLRIYGCPSIRWLSIGAMAHDGTPFWGDDKYPNSAYFTGRMDDLRIYNRTLSPADVQALYAGWGSLALSKSVSAQRSASNAVNLAWDTLSNAYYRVEWRNSTVSGSWATLTNILGDGGTNSLIDQIQPATNRFYRVRPLP